MIELDNGIPDANELLGVDKPLNVAFWAVWDTIKIHRFKLHWGIFRPSFRLVVVEPIVVKLLGPRNG